MVYRKELTYDDFLDVLDVKNFAGSIFEMLHNQALMKVAIIF